MGLEQDFPVRENAVPRVHVPPHRLDEWKEVAQDEITRAISHRHSWYNAFKDRVRDGYDMIADKPHLKAFVRPVPSTTDKDILVRSTLPGVTLDDLVHGLYCGTTYDVRCLFAHLYEGNFLDGAILQVHEGATEEDPMHFVGMRWIAFRSPAPAVMTSRDFLYFSYEGTAYDMDGHRVLFRFLRSMPMEDDVVVDDAHLPPLVRGKISNLHLYRQNGGAHVDAFTKAMHSNAGNMPSWVVTKTITFMFPGIVNIETAPDARALLALGMAKLNPHRLRQCNKDWTSSTPTSSSTHRSTPTQASVASLAALTAANTCGVCFHKFKMTRAKRRCQACCREVCKRCTRQIHLFDEAKQLSETGIVALRFCINCMRQARNEIRESAAYSVASSRSSFSTRRSSSGSHHDSNNRQLARRHPRSASVEYHHQHHQHTTASQGMYDHDDIDADDGSGSYNGYNANGLLTSQAMGGPGHSAPLPTDQLLQLQQLQQQHHISQQDHEEFLRLYGQYATAARQNKLISFDQLSRTKQRPAPPPPPQIIPASHQYGAPPAQVHPNAGTFRRHNNSGGGGGVGWTHAAAAQPPPSSSRTPSNYAQSPPPLRNFEPVPRHMIPPMPQPDRHLASGGGDMISLSKTTNMNRYQSAPQLPSYDQHRPPLQQRSVTTASSTSSTGSHDTAASEDLEAIFRMRMMLFDGNTTPQESDTLSTTSSNSSHARRKADPMGGHQPLHHHLLQHQAPQPIVQRF